ncbi:MAG: DsbA family protein [Actinomycetota bacterium]|nr:DsbA family protein [Actinomycetota bacterium]MDP9020444.1 DsbA family protein [Actinomycetota bacterium]
MIDVAPRTIVVFADIACPWASVAVHRLHATRSRLGLDGEVELDHHAFPLELVNGRPTPKRVLDAELPVAGALVPDAGWQMWQRPADEWPVTTLPALEAVQAAKAQSLVASASLDLALRRALFAESCCISLRPVVLEVAGSCPEVDVAALAEALDEGRARRQVMDDLDRAQSAEVQGSPHLFLADGSDTHNPGVRLHWQGAHGRGFPVVDADDPSVYDDLLRRAAS